MSNAQITALAVPANTIDKIIFADTYSVIRPDSVTATTLSCPGSAYEGLPTAIYSWDNGATWHDAVEGTSYSDFSTTIPVQLYVASKSDGTMVLSFNQTATVNGGVDYTLTVKFAITARPGMATIDSTATSFSGKTAYNTTRQYLNIATQGSFSVDLSGANTTTITHNLGYIPYCLAYSDSTSTALLDPNVYVVTATTTSITISNSAIGGGGVVTIYYKIYEKS